MWTGAVIAALVGGAMLAGARGGEVVERDGQVVRIDRAALGYQAP